MCRGKERGRVRQEQDRTGWLGSKADDHSGSQRDGKAGHTVARRPQVLPVRVGQKSRAAAGQQPRRAGGVQRAAVTDWTWAARGTHAQRPRGTPRNDTTQETAFRPPLTSGKSWRAGCKPLPPTKDRAGTVRQCTQTISRPARSRDRLLCYSYTVRVRRATAAAAAGGCRSGPDKNTAACDEAAGAANRLPLLLWPGSSAKASAPPQTRHSPSRRGVSNSAMRIGVGVGGGGGARGAPTATAAITATAVTTRAPINGRHVAAASVALLPRATGTRPWQTTHFCPPCRPSAASGAILSAHAARGWPAHAPRRTTLRR